MNSTVEVSFEEGTDAEKADIEIRSFGCVNELRFADDRLSAIANLRTSDVGRLLQALRFAEEQRVAPDTETLNALDHLRERFSMFTEEDPTRMTLDVDLVLPIASCGSVLLEPNPKVETIE